MKERLKARLFERCKDMGLTAKALEELADLGASTLPDTATDEEIASKADSLAPFAKAMQAEITRKTRREEPKPKPKAVEEPAHPATPEEPRQPAKDEEPTWFAPFRQKLAQLESENQSLKAERMRSERADAIREKAKRLGIPDYLMKRVSLGDEADIDKELEEYKQELVNNSLLPKQAASPSSVQDQMRKEADVWAASLPNKN